jgi:regulatory protein
MGFRKKVRSMGPEAASDIGAARNAAASLLGRRDFATGRLSAKLQQRGFDPATAGAAVAELVEGRYLDDGRYAARFVSYQAERGQGPLRIVADLRASGVPDSLIDAAIAAGPDWRALARRVRERRFGPELPREWAEKGRQARFLQYRGFSSDHVRLALGADLDPD